MLYEFHRTENKKKANSVHATYLVAGSRHEPESNGVIKDGNDVVMSSQPFQSSPPAPAVAIEDDTPILSITLVREEDLEEARKSYESIVSIHVYSLGPTKVKDFQILSDANRKVLEKYAGQNGAEYGTITNKHVRKRNVGGPRLVPKDAPAPVPAVKPKTPAQKTSEVKQEEAKPEMAPENKADGPSASGPAVKGKTGSNFFGQPSGATIKKEAKTPNETPASSTASKPTAPKRGNSGSIFASFAKAKPKEKSGSVSAASSTAQSPVVSAVEDETMKDVSDEEEEEEEEVAPKPKPRVRAANKKGIVKKETAAERKQREEREKKLRDMMEESDEESVKSKSTTPAVVTQDDEEDQPEQLAPPKKDKPEPKEYVEISGGRRRGKRRVMKKKTIRDEEGYLGMLIPIT